MIFWVIMYQRGGGTDLGLIPKISLGVPPLKHSCWKWLNFAARWSTLSWRSSWTSSRTSQMLAGRSRLFGRTRSSPTRCQAPLTLYVLCLGFEACVRQGGSEQGRICEQDGEFIKHIRYSALAKPQTHHVLFCLCFRIVFFYLIFRSFGWPWNFSASSLKLTSRGWMIYFIIFLWYISE